MDRRQPDPEIAWLYGLQHFGVKLGLETIRALLDLLDQPQRAFPAILVGGTNGKGSVSAMLHAMLEAAGVRAGLFTSPHLVRPEERIRIGNDDIAPATLRSLLARLRRNIDDALAAGRLSGHPSFFEVVTAAALLAFREAGVRAAVLEVGLGGRLDATNAVDARVAVVVSVDYDHTRALGDTIAAITAEKAGIVKFGRPLVSGAVRQQAIDVLRRTCAARSAPYVDARLAARLSSEDGSGFALETARGRYPDLRPGLAGRYQIGNARVALAAFEALAPAIEIEPRPEAVRTGLSRVRWPGRLQWVAAPDRGPRLLLDGAHNPAGARVLAHYLETAGLPRPVLLVGTMSDKPVEELLRILGPHVRAAVVTRPPVLRAADVDRLAALARGVVEHVEVEPEPGCGLERARSLAGPDGVVLVAGSLYLVGEILGLLEGGAVPGPVSM